MTEPASNPGGWAAALQIGPSGDLQQQQQQAGVAASGQMAMDHSQQLNLAGLAPMSQAGVQYQQQPMGIPQMAPQYTQQGVPFDPSQFQAVGSVPLALPQQLTPQQLQQLSPQQLQQLMAMQQQQMQQQHQAAMLAQQLAPQQQQQPQPQHQQDEGQVAAMHEQQQQQQENVQHHDPQQQHMQQVQQHLQQAAPQQAAGQAVPPDMAVMHAAHQQADPNAVNAEAYAAQMAAAQQGAADAQQAVALHPQQPGAAPDLADYVEPNAVEEGRAKPCRLCGRVQMLSNFHVNNSNADKHDTRCKRCCAEYEKQKRAKKQRVHEPTVTEKVCRTCQELKQAGEFYRYTYSKDGLYQQCKACHARAGEDRLARLAATDSKTCSKCGQEKGKAEFYASKYLSSGLHSQCKRCVRQGQEKKVRCPPENAAPSKVCRKCRSEKPAVDFYLNKLVSDGLSTYCRECSQAGMRGSGGGGEDGLPPPRSGARYNVETPTKLEKHCKKCNETKPAEEFYHIKSSSDGLASNCKKCAVAIANATRKHYHEEPTVPHKMCKQCGTDKPAEAFYRNRTNADGLFGKCKVCSDQQAEQNRKPRVRHNISEPTVDHKVCTKCNEDKPSAEFNRDKTKADGLQFRCKLCVHEYMKRRRRNESTRKRDQMEAQHAEQHALATDNLAVLAQVTQGFASSREACLPMSVLPHFVRRNMGRNTACRAESAPRLILTFSSLSGSWDSED